MQFPKSMWIGFFVVLLWSYHGVALGYENQDSVSPAVESLPDYGDVIDSRTFSLRIWLKPQHQKELDSLLSEQHTSGSKYYLKWLSPGGVPQTV